ncbi:MAG: redoxin domain-containing protein [Gemmataceae bacterium]|nr:redoxin domain-containing protein [Gemmataceae bacterium]
MSWITRRPVSSFLLLASVGLLAAWLWLRPPADVRAYRSVLSAWEADEDAGALARRALETIRSYPGSVGGIAALMLAAAETGDADAMSELRKQVSEADLDRIARALDHAGPRLRKLEAFAPAFLARARADGDDPRAGRLAATACLLSRPLDKEPLPLYREAADLIAEKFAASPHIGHFPEGLAGVGTLPWAAPYEKHLRAILAANEDRRVRCATLYALATLVEDAGEERQEEAERLFARFLDEFDGKRSYSYQGIEQRYRQQAEGQAAELRQRAAGRPAPALEGTSLDGKPLSLASYKGRAVLLSVWATWCFPCMKLVPHEKALAERLKGKPFALLGVNCDQDKDKARAAAARTGMGWPSFSEGTRIVKEWRVFGYPTLYLIDHHGIIRKRWIGAPPPATLDRHCALLADAAERNLPSEAIRPLLAPVAEEAKPAAPARPGGAFQEKAVGSDRYNVFVPAGDGPFPALLSLHGSGSRGDDPKLAVRHGLAKGIRERKGDFPFLVVFPQAREGEDWRAGGAGARRALAALAHAQKEFRIDSRRVSLTGVSMGGQGTWSLAAADPGRWACIVPVCHGGDERTAAKLKDIPCWCFHGEQDRMIPPSQSRSMVKAVQEAGGTPLYHEFPGTGHDDCADRAYALPDLWEWVLAQRGR